MSELALGTFEDIPDRMLWKGAALNQLEGFRQLAKNVGLPCSVPDFPDGTPAHHISKSIRLPVVCLIHGGMRLYLRDNFYDVNVCAVAEEPLTTPLAELFDGVLQPRDWDWYMEEVGRCRGYSWKGWTDEQMDDPLLLFPGPDAPSYQTKERGEKARWVARAHNPAWYHEDWSSGRITWDGMPETTSFGPGTLWIQRHPFLEGISRLVPEAAVYKPGCTDFAIAVPDLDRAERLIRNLTGAGTPQNPSAGA